MVYSRLRVLYFFLLRNFRLSILPVMARTACNGGTGPRFTLQRLSIKQPVVEIMDVDILRRASIDSGTNEPQHEDGIYIVDANVFFWKNIARRSK